MPTTVFTVGVMLGTEKYAFLYALNMLVVGVGVAAASYGAPGCGGGWGCLSEWLVVVMG